MALTEKQKKFILDFTKYRARKNLFILAGGAGSGKSFVCLLLLHKLCLEFAPIRVGVFRKSTVNLKNNTIPSYLRVLTETKTQKSVVLSDFKATYKNGSEILFLWADSEKDPDCNNIKGLELSCALFEEVNQVEKHVFHTVRSRVGRWNTNIRSLKPSSCEACENSESKNKAGSISCKSPDGVACGFFEGKKSLKSTHSNNGQKISEIRLKKPAKSAKNLCGDGVFSVGEVFCDEKKQTISKNSQKYSSNCVSADEENDCADFYSDEIAGENPSRTPYCNTFRNGEEKNLPEESQGGEVCGFFESGNSLRLQRSFASRNADGGCSIKEVKRSGVVDFPPFVLANCNPNNTWVKHDFYDPYIERKLPEYAYFQESLPFDNKNLTKDYIKMLESLPPEQKRRYLHNDWYYSQDSNSLISQEFYNAVTVESKPEGLFGDVILAIDPADEGADLTVFAYMQGGCVFRFETFEKQNEVKSAYVALLRAKEFGIKPYNIIVDSVGVGAGCLNTLLLEGFLATKFVGGESPRSELPFYNFKNKRAEAAWLLRESIYSNSIKIIKNQRLHNEILAINYALDSDKTIVLQPKKEIKKTLGHSPDFFDALMMANYRNREMTSRPLTALNARPKRLSSFVEGY